VLFVSSNNRYGLTTAVFNSPRSLLLVPPFFRIALPEAPDGDIAAVAVAMRRRRSQCLVEGAGRGEASALVEKTVMFWRREGKEKVGY
jgi:hypothetical protein